MSNKALFLDRDGIINEDRSYVYRIEDFAFTEGIFEVLRYARSKHYRLVIITNQAGIGRGYYTEADFHHLNSWMLTQLEKESIVIDKVYYCPYHPTHGIGKYRRESDCRKPAPGMITQAVAELNLDVSQSVLLGDKESDIEAGRRAQVGTNVLLKSPRYFKNSTQADRVVDTLPEVKQFLR